MRKFLFIHSNLPLGPKILSVVVGGDGRGGAADFQDYSCIFITVYSNLVYMMLVRMFLLRGML